MRNVTLNNTVAMEILTMLIVMTIHVGLYHNRRQSTYVCMYMRLKSPVNLPVLIIAS